MSINAYKKVLYAELVQVFVVKEKKKHVLKCKKVTTFLRNLALRSFALLNLSNFCWQFKGDSKGKNSNKQPNKQEGRTTMLQT